MALHDIPELDTKGLRQFGLILGGIFCFLFGLFLPWVWNWEFLPNWIFIGIGIFIGFWALIGPDSMGGLYRGWMYVALRIGNVINAFILSIVFYLVMMPMGLVMRLAGKDPLRLKLDSQAKSYRVESKVNPKSHMERPF